MMHSRRQLLTACAALAVAGTGLTGCGRSDGSANVGTGPAAAEAAFPVTIGHKFGDTTLSKAPERIVVVGLKEQDDLLALGIVPVGATKWLDLDRDGIVGSWAEAALGAAPMPKALDDQDGIEFEQIAALAPDLILALYAGLTADDYAKLTRLAPVVAQPKDVVDWGIAWDVQALTVGKAVGRPDQMQALVDGAKKAIADVAADNPQFAGKVGLVATPYQGIYVYGAQDPRSRLLTELGFRLPDDINTAVGADQFGGNISAEKLEFLDTDVLLWFAGPDEQKSIEDNALYRQLDVYTEGRAIYSAPGDRIDDPFSFVTVLSLPYLLANLTPRLRAAVDGDPATGTGQP